MDSSPKESLNPKHPLIGDSAPAFDAETTEGPIHFPKDYTGKWVILFSHPADFTPVCTTEFIAFSQLVEECHKLNTELIGLSVDSLSSHIAWLYAIQEQVRFRGLSQVKITFPLIADLSQTIARRYGMIHPKVNENKTIRAVYFIDPDGIIRTILYYPISTGRNFNEILRILMSLQTADAFDVATPADWTPGDDVIDNPPETLPQARQTGTATQRTSHVWFLKTKKLPRDKIQKKLKKNHSTKSAK
ncbi:MAG: peroxiredoxin [Pseudomonadota bacterium]|nr:peroxiredoxin [Pseudomonadota bacterium]